MYRALAKYTPARTSHNIKNMSRSLFQRAPRRVLQKETLALLYPASSTPHHRDTALHHQQHQHHHHHLQSLPYFLAGLGLVGASARHPSAGIVCVEALSLCLFCAFRCRRRTLFSLGRRSKDEHRRDWEWVGADSSIPPETYWMETLPLRRGLR